LGLNGQGHGGDGVEQSLHGGTGAGWKNETMRKNGRWRLKYKRC
jgi:hypothetical protein